HLEGGGLPTRGNELVEPLGESAAAREQVHDGDLLGLGSCHGDTLAWPPPIQVRAPERRANRGARSGRTPTPMRKAGTRVSAGKRAKGVRRRAGGALGAATLRGTVA